MPRWKNTLQKLFDDYALSDAALELARFEKCYSEPHRKYHTLAHIDHLLLQIERVFTESRERAYQSLLDESSSGTDLRAANPSNELLLAALYHDVIYDTARTDNEEQSARFVATVLARCINPPPDIARVQNMIRATKHSGDFEATDDETKLLLDADMSILGTSKEVYEEYVRNVRVEYKQVTDELWKYHRVRFLIGCLKSTRIYCSTYFSKLEKQARQNIADEALSLL